MTLGIIKHQQQGTYLTAHYLGKDRDGQPRITTAWTQQQERAGVYSSSEWAKLQQHLPDCTFESPLR